METQTGVKKMNMDELKAFHVTTLEFSTDKKFTYQVIAKSEKDAKHKIIASIENRTKKGDTVYDVWETASLFEGQFA